MRHAQINQHVIAPASPTYIVAEVSANHNHDFERAIEIIRAAKQAGADAIKLQTYTPDTLTINCDREWFRIGAGSLWEGKNLYQLYGEAYTPWEWHPKLMTVAAELGLDCFSTSFDATAVDFLESLNVPAHKVASFELVDLPLLKKIAQTRKPVIASTGMASLAEIDEAVKTLRAHGTTQLVLLKCTSAYPALPSEMNLHTIPHLAQTFGVVAGLSDHTLGSSVAVAAVALSARVIEKHFTLRRADGGPDSAFSMEPNEFAQMVKDIRQVEQALGAVSYERTPDEQKNLVFRRSLFVVSDVQAGEMFTEKNVRVIRPGQGLPPRYLEVVLGKKAARAIRRGTPLEWGMIS
jgi:pseudaminic acid synthase